MIEINVDCLLKQRKKRRRLLEQREARAIMTIELLTKQITPIAANSHPIRIRFASNSQPIRITSTAPIFRRRSLDAC